MDSLKVQSFIKDLNFDLNTVRYLFDYGRVKETLPIVDRILDNIHSFKSDNLENDLKGVFSEEFWRKKISISFSMSDMHSNIRKYSQLKTSSIDKDLEKIEYKEFVENVFIWSENNIPLIRGIIKSPFQRSLEKMFFCSLLISVGLYILFLMVSGFINRDFGLKGEFYKGIKFDQKISSGVNKTINFNYSSQMKADIPAEEFSARWSGYLLVPQDLQYTFSLLVDDGARLIIDDKPVIDQWGYHDAVEFSNSIFLKKGYHSIRVEYFNGCCNLTLKLFWKPENGKKEIIPSKYFRLSLK